jgi:hypothetical protein
MTASEVHFPYARRIVVGAGLIVCALLLYFTRNFTFYFDEWTFITTSVGWTLASYFEPHNEHPTMLLKLLYAALLNTVGLRSYVPYMAAVLLAHLANVLLLFELVRRRAGELIAVVAALLLLVMGMGWEALLWAFQVGWLASMAFGLAALVILQTNLPSRAAVGAALIAVSLSFAGTGIVFAVAGAVQLLLTAERRRELLWFVAPAVALLAWYVAFGRFGLHPDPQPTAANLLLAPLYTVWGLSQGIAGIIGVSGWFGYPLLVGAMGALAWTWRRHGFDPFTAGIAAGLVAFFLVAGTTRAQLGWQQSGASRYVYVAGFMWLVLLGEAARSLPWRGTWRPALAALAFLACFNSAVVLVEFGSAKTLQMQRAVADVQALAAERNDPCLDPNAHADALVMPDVQPLPYYGAVDRYGDPAAGKPIQDRKDFQVAVANLRKPGC